jgi:hypothetical protein
VCKFWGQHVAHTICVQAQPVSLLAVEETGEQALIRGRSEYVALVVSFVLVGLEALIRVLTLALRMIPPPALLYKISMANDL